MRPLADLSSPIGAARFDPELGIWSAPVTVASSGAPTHHLSFLSIATDGQGNAFGTWTANLPDTDEEAATASRFDGTSNAWSVPYAFETRRSIVGTRAAMGTAGQGWALSTQPNDSGAAELTARELRADGSWSPAQVIGHGRISDAEANAQGVVLVGAELAWYSSAQPMFANAPAATFFVPR